MKALIIVDMQNDFCPGGALAVREGNNIIPLINQLQNMFDLVVATQDFHPANHKSFASNHSGKTVGDIIELSGINQVLWPNHCVEGTKGAELVPSLDKSRINRIFKKGTDPSIDSYSAFFDNNHKKSTGLHGFLKSRGIAEIYIAGLATDYCVKYTAIDGVKLGYKTTVIIDACRGIDLDPGDIRESLVEMARAGVRITTSPQMLQIQRAV